MDVVNSDMPGEVVFKLMVEPGDSMSATVSQAKMRGTYSCDNLLQVCDCIQLLYICSEGFFSNFSSQIFLFQIGF